MTKGCAYYSSGYGNWDLLQACRWQLQRAAGDLPIAAVSLDPLGDRPSWAAPVFSNVAWHDKPSYLTMFKQILAALETLKTDVAFLCEHDVLYHPSHFNFSPMTSLNYFYNRNVWKVRASDGHALHYPCDQTSGLCADRELLVAHYRKRVESVAERGFSRANGFEPGTRTVAQGGYDDFRSVARFSAHPNIDIRHSTNLTESRWRKDQFRNQKYTEGWTEGSGVPGWGETAGRFPEFLHALGRVEVT